eukprot:125843-Prymnesium_polylepis.1
MLSSHVPNALESRAPTKCSRVTWSRVTCSVGALGRVTCSQGFGSRAHRSPGSRAHLRPLGRFFGTRLLGSGVQLGSRHRGVARELQHAPTHLRRVGVKG